MKIFNRLNKISKNRKVINIICKNYLGEITYVEQLPFNKKYNCLYNVVEYIKIKNSYLRNTNFFPSYDKEIKKNIIFNCAKNNQYIINWDQDFDKLAIPNVFKELQTNAVTIILVEVIGDLGAAEGVIDYLEILRMIKLIIKKIKLLIEIKINPYKVLEKHIRYDEEFIKDVIYKSKRWPAGFICSENIEFKDVIEKKIMKQLGYKRKYGNWISKDDHFKYPHELV